MNAQMKLLNLLILVTFMLKSMPTLAGGDESSSAESDASQDKNVAAVVSFLRYLEQKDMEPWFALWHEEGVQDMPYAPDQFPNRFDGIEALRNHWKQVPDLFETISFSNLNVYPMQDPNLVYAEFDGDLLSKATGRNYKNDYASFFMFQDGKIILYREYFNPLVLLKDFGIEAVDQEEE